MEEIVVRGENGQEFRFEVAEVRSPAEPSFVEDDVLVGGIDQEQARDACDRLAILNEALTGYASGDSSAPRPGEPKPEFDPELVPSKIQRFLNMRRMLGAREGSSDRTYQRWEAALIREGLYGLVDQRTGRKKTGSTISADVVEATVRVLEQQGTRSKISKKNIRLMVALELGLDDLPGGSRASFNKLLDQLGRRVGVKKTAKAERSYRNGPRDDLGFLPVDRPGEIVAIDSTKADIFAFDPVSGKALPLEMTIAIDVYTRSIISFSLTPVGTKAIDLIYMLADMCSPAPLDRRWPTDIPYPYVGVPEVVLLRSAGLPDGTPIKPRPQLRPESVLVDRGGAYQSYAFTAGCGYLGISILSARPHTPTDKPWVERAIQTIQTGLFQLLPGYKGSNTLMRGESPETEALLTVDELQQVTGRYIAEIYQNTVQTGIQIPEAPHVGMSPNDAYEQGIEQSGFVSIPLDPNFHLHLLETRAATIQDEGIKFEGLRYKSDVLRSSAFEHCPRADGKWEFKVDPRDRRQIWIQDPWSRQWHEIPWRFRRDHPRPFSSDALKHIKKDCFETDPIEREHQINRKLVAFMRDLTDGSKLLHDRKLRVEAAKTAHREETTSPVPAENLVRPELPMPESEVPSDFPRLEIKN